MMLMNIPTVAKIYAMNSAHPAVRTQRTRLIVKIGSLLDQTIRRWMLYHTLLTVGAMSVYGRNGTDHLQGVATKTGCAGVFDALLRTFVLVRWSKPDEEEV